MKVGLSFDQGGPEYRLYVGALLVAAERAGVELETFWLAGKDRPLDRSLLETLDGFVLTGGADIEPRRYGSRDAQSLCRTFDGRDAAEFAILKYAFSRRAPMLAICRGLELVNVFQGGTLLPDIRGHDLADHERHPVMLEAGSALALLLGAREGSVSSCHHQAVGDLGEGLQVAARHADGTIEAIEWIQPTRRPWMAAVQWHPELMGPDEPFAAPLWRGFLQAVATRRTPV
jgi:putative glutamine amidotransferase